MAKIASDPECLAAHRQKDKERKRQQREKIKEKLTKQQKEENLTARENKRRD